MLASEAMNQPFRYTPRVIAFLVSVLVGYVVSLFWIKAIGPVEPEAFTAWATSEFNPVEQINLFFVFVCFVEAIVWLRRGRGASGGRWRVFVLVYFTIWFLEEAQYGQALLGFVTPTWWRHLTGDNALDLHTVITYGCFLTIAMFIATGLIFLRYLVRAIKGDRLGWAAVAIPPLVLATNLALPVGEWVWQLYLSYFLAAVLLLEIRRVRE